MSDTTININRWCAGLADAYREFEQVEMAMYPSADDRDQALVEWVVRCLGNPDCEGASDVVALLAERHGTGR